jgi:hypothetical protein
MFRVARRGMSSASTLTVAEVVAVVVVEVEGVGTIATSSACPVEYFNREETSGVCFGFRFGFGWLVDLCFESADPDPAPAAAPTPLAATSPAPD